MAATMLDAARELLARGRFALVGVSRDEKSFSRAVLRELARRGHDVVPVHPALAEAEGRRCFARVQDVAPPVAAAIVMTPPDRAAEVVRDCAAAGVRTVWFHRGAGSGSASAEALALCRANGIEVVSDLCPFMALPDAGWLHRAHAFLRRAAHRPFDAT
jgi:predicted CoA-binding protein